MSLPLTCHSEALYNKRHHYVVNEQTAVHWTPLDPYGTSLRTWPMIAFLDANARVGSVVSSSVGPFQAQPENASGEAFHRWLIEEDLVVPQTFDHMHSGPGSTWTHSTGAVARLDYLAISQCLVNQCAVRTKIADIDLSISKQDHSAVLLEIDMTLKIPLPNDKMDHPVIDWNFDWEADVHSHAAHLQNYIRHNHHQDRPRLRPRRAHMTESTWQLVLAKKYHWRRQRDLSHTMRIGTLRAIFSAWAHHTDSPECRPWLRLAQLTHAMHAHQHGLLARKVSAAFVSDDRQYYDGLAQSAGDAADEGLHCLWKQIKAVLPKQQQKRRSSLKCLGPDGAELAQHYCTLEAGEPTSYPALLQECFDRQRDHIPDAPLSADLTSFPTRLELERLCRKAKNGKAPGIDGLPAETLKISMQDASNLLHVLFFKAWATGAEPLQYKGGLVWSIAKRPGAYTVDGLRGIALLETMGKIFHALLRQRLMSWTLPHKLDTQFGGYRGQQIAFPSLLLRSFIDYVDRKRMSTALVFVDIRSAFHCLLRELIFGTRDHFPPALVHLLEQEGFNVESLQASIGSNAALFQDTATPLLARVTADAHQSTWFVSPGTESSQCYATHRGSRPGSPVADIAYNILMSAILRQIERRLLDHPVVQDACALLGVTPPIITWVDDVAIPVISRTAHNLIDATTEILQLVLDTFCSFGLRLNLSKGKTEVLMQHRGPGSPDLRRAIFTDEFAQIPITNFGRQDSVRVVSAYKHLGSVVVASLSVAHDVTCRMAKASASFHQLSRPIFLNRKIGVQTRLKLLEALVIPMITFGCGHWPLLPHRIFVRLNHLILKWQRSIINDGFWQDQTSPDWRLQAKWKLVPLTIRLRKHRLLFALQLAKHAPNRVWELATADDLPSRTSTWIHALRQALDWYRGFITRFDTNHVPENPISAEQISLWLVGGGMATSARINSAVRRFVLQEHTIDMVLTEHSTLSSTLQDTTVDFTRPPESLSQDPLPYQCDQCSRRFATPQGLNTHGWVMHRHISLERRYIHSTTCLSCNKCYWTVQRLQQHLRHSRRHPDGCLARLVHNMVPLSDPATIPSELPDPHAFRMPCVAAAGPAMPPMIPLWERTHRASVESWHDQWKLHGFPEDLSGEVQLEIEDLAESLTRQWFFDDSPVDDLVFAWMHGLDPYYEQSSLQGDAALWAFMHWGVHGMYDLIPELVNEDPDRALLIDPTFLQTVESFPMWELLQQRDSLNAAGAPPTLDLALPSPGVDERRFHSLELGVDHLSQQTELLHPFVNMEFRQWNRPLGVPMVRLPDGKLCIYAVHLFSGRRRQDDWHDALHAAFASHFPDIVLKILSVDTANEADLCNLLSPKCLEPLYRLARAGCFGLAMSGPPCETWSSARHLPPPSDIDEQRALRWPHPLRSASRPWGLESLTARELHQLHQGSRLMLTNLNIDLLVATRGGGTGMEHPDLPFDMEHASIWRTETHRCYHMQFPGATILHVPQWQFGASAIKPTALRFLGLPGISRAFWAQRDVEYTKPVTTLHGYDYNARSFTTAKAKEYPAHFSRAIAVSMVISLADRWRREGATIVDFSQLGERDCMWLDAIEAASSRYQAHGFCPDYQPSRGWCTDLMCMQAQVLDLAATEWKKMWWMLVDVGWCWWSYVVILCYIILCFRDVLVHPL